MKYYLLEQDRSYSNIPQLLNWYKKIDERNVHMGRYGKLPDKTMIYIKPDKNIFFPDILLYPFLMINTDVKEKLQQYEPNMNFKVLFLVDKENGSFQYYCIPFIKEISCVSEKSKFNLDRSVIHKLVLKKEQIPKGIPLFMVAGVNCRCVVIRMDFVESILKKGVYGITLHEIAMEES